jgi:hypothetical protein
MSATTKVFCSDLKLTDRPHDQQKVDGWNTGQRISSERSTRPHDQQKVSGWNKRQGKPPERPRYPCLHGCCPSGPHKCPTYRGPQLGRQAPVRAPHRLEVAQGGTIHCRVHHKGPLNKRLSSSLKQKSCARPCQGRVACKASEAAYCPSPRVMQSLCMRHQVTTPAAIDSILEEESDMHLL